MAVPIHSKPPIRWFTARCVQHAPSYPLQGLGRNILGEPQVNVTDRLAGLVQEQHSVRSGLLNHLRVDVVAVRPSSGVFVVGVRNQAREVGLLVARGGIVEGKEAERETGDRDVEASLS
jgi:hypothetical protein